MFGFFSSVEKQMRANAANWLELAEKIYHYRRDELSAGDRADLQQKTETLRAQLRDRADASKLKLGIEGLEPALKRTGGKFYPRSTLQEYVEFFVVAAIVVLGIRAYFLQPFKIPTNSMWPTYYGMTPEVYRKTEDVPNAVTRALRLVAFGATHKQVIAPASGPVVVPFGGGGRLVAFNIVKGRKWLIIPARLREYTFLVGDKPVSFRVPEDFDFDWALAERLGMTREQLGEFAYSALSKARGTNAVTLPIQAEAGKSFLSFDIMTGDNLFVDRMSYHFVKPSVGDGFVFRTGDIPGIAYRYGDQYYIKRLAGTPGDTLEIKEPALLRNGAPITGADAFDANAKREGKYRGYLNWASGSGSLLRRGEKIEVPPDSFVALGDNSANSADSRDWGFVPAKDVVGRPLFIYYPFTTRWGIAR